jgi:hypothetical protein
MGVTAMVERELALGPDRRIRHEERLRSLQVESDFELATAIRSGTYDGRREDVIHLLLLDAVEKLTISNPRYIEDTDSALATGP